MTSKNIRILFAAFDQTNETVAKMREFMFQVFNIVYSAECRGKIVSSGEMDTDSGCETHQIDARSREQFRDRCLYTIRLQKCDDINFIVLSDFDVVVLFVSAAFLYKRPEKESWFAYVQSFFTRLAPVLVNDRYMYKLWALFEEMRASGGNYRLQNSVWVVVTDDDDCVRKSEWSKAEYSTNYSRTIFLRKDDPASTVKYLWAHISE